MITVRRALLAFSLLCAIAACGSNDDAQSPDTPLVVPDLTGYHLLELAPSGSARGSGAPAGAFHYLLIDGALDWFVTARHLPAGRAYRIVLTAADGLEYAVASERSAADGSFVAHGVESMLMNRQCVGTEDPSRRPFSTVRSLRVALKSDGSARGTSGNNMLGSRSSLPCSGNGDGVFDYVLRSVDSLSLVR